MQTAVACESQYQTWWNVLIDVIYTLFLLSGLEETGGNPRKTLPLYFGIWLGRFPFLMHED